VRDPAPPAPAPVPSASLSTTPPPAGSKLVVHGDLSARGGQWSTFLWPPYSPPEPLPLRVDAGELCVAVKAGQNVIVGWPGGANTPHGFELVAGQRYRLSFRARTTGSLPLRVVAKVGHQEMPFTPAVQAPIPLDSQPHVFAVDFEPEQADAKAGVAFVLSAPRGDAQNDVCLGDVSVTGGV
jgi:hypothetical protein